jgi:hypothetical protein
MLKMKVKLLFLFTSMLFINICFSQVTEDTLNKALNGFKTDRDAKFGVFKIVQYSGLSPNFRVIQDTEVKNAIAYIKGKKRYIRYNPSFMKRVNDSTKTDWAAISVLAHEIGHHLVGHTLRHQESNPGDELAADRYSGFILFQMGATLEETLRCVETEGNLHGTKTHPPRSARIDVITEGWKDAKNLKNKKITDFSPERSNIEETFKYTCSFVGDENTYYVNNANQMVWYDNYANPIVIGVLKESKGKNYKWDYLYDKTLYKIDTGGAIWLITTYGSSLKVGELNDINSPIEKK